MKFRLMLFTAAFWMFSSITPAIFSQTKAQQPVTIPTSTPPPANVPSDPGVSGTVPQAAPADSTTQNTQTIQPADPSKVKHDGGKDDVDAIGNRKMGARGLGNWYSIESDIKMGKQYAQMVDSSSKLVSDPMITEYVNRLGQNLVRNSDAQVPFTFKIIDSDVVNAMSLPGGYVYVDTATILAADGEAELAGVMAHEIAHVAARHATRQMTRGNYANIGTLPLIFMGGGVGYAVRAAAGIGMPMAFMSFQRGFEAEADYLGLEYMYKAGYDPQSFVSFFEKLQALEKKKPGTLAKTFSSHPQTPDRIAASQEEIEKILPARPEYTVTTSEFDDVKARLAQLENRRKVIDDKDTSKPSLRRASATDAPKDGTTTKGDDDHPTLKRRDDSN
jgi:beta-barrel assembly-enhancing protease